MQQQQLSPESADTEARADIPTASETQTLQHIEENQEIPLAETPWAEKVVARMRRRQRRLLLLMYGGMFALMPLPLFFLFLYGPIFHPHHLSGLLLAGICQVTGLLLLVLSLMTVNRRTADEWAELDDIRVIGPLLDACCLVGGLHVQQTARQALADLLPRLKSSDAALLNSRQRKLLRSLLLNGSEKVVSRAALVDLVVIILRAYEQIGDRRDLSAVKKLALGKSSVVPTWARDSRVRDAATACLPYLQARVQPEQGPETLLRPSSPADAPDTTLLRAAHDAQESHPQQLLRASTTEEAD